MDIGFKHTIHTQLNQDISINGKLHDTEASAMLRAH